MICEPYICIKGKRAGEIMWTIIESSDAQGVEICHEHCKDGCINCAGGNWQPYADFEREKLLALKTCTPIILKIDAGYYLKISNGKGYVSGECNSYDSEHFLNDSESSRLLKRAEFLHEVCRREGIAWIVDG